MRSPVFSVMNLLARAIVFVDMKVGRVDVKANASAAERGMCQPYVGRGGGPTADFRPEGDGAVESGENPLQRGVGRLGCRHKPCGHTPGRGVARGETRLDAFPEPIDYYCREQPQSPAFSGEIRHEERSGGSDHRRISDKRGRNGRRVGHVGIRERIGQRLRPAGSRAVESYDLHGGRSADKSV